MIDESGKLQNCSFKFTGRDEVTHVQSVCLAKKQNDGRRSTDTFCQRACVRSTHLEHGYNIDIIIYFISDNLPSEIIFPLFSTH